MASRLVIAECVNGFVLHYPTYRPEKDDLPKIVALWENIVGDIDDATLKAACLSLMASDRAFAPNAGEVRSESVRLEMRLAGYPSEYEAYQEVMDMPPSMERKRVAHDGDDTPYIECVSLRWSNPLVGEAARQVGWPKTFPTDNPSADRAQFYRVYSSLIARQAEKRADPPAVKTYLESSARPALESKPSAANAMLALTKRMEKTK